MLRFLQVFKTKPFILFYSFSYLRLAHLFLLEFIMVELFNEEHGWITSIKSPSFGRTTFIASLINYPDNYRLNVTKWAIHVLIVIIATVEATSSLKIHSDVTWPYGPPTSVTWLQLLLIKEWHHMVALSPAW
jgi:hypothetical protein